MPKAAGYRYFIVFCPTKLAITCTGTITEVKHLRPWIFFWIRVSWVIFYLKCGAVALIWLKKRRGSAVAHVAARCRELKIVARAQHWGWGCLQNPYSGQFLEGKKQKQFDLFRKKWFGYLISIVDSNTLYNSWYRYLILNFTSIWNLILIQAVSLIYMTVWQV